MFGHRSPMRQINCVGGNGMASLGKGIFYVIGGMFILGCLGKAFIPLVLVAGLVYLIGKKR